MCSATTNFLYHYTKLNKVHQNKGDVFMLAEKEQIMHLSMVRGQRVGSVGRGITGRLTFVKNLFLTSSPGSKTWVKSF